MKIRPFTLAVICYCLIACSDDKGSIPATADLAIMPEVLDDGWEVKDISEAGLDAKPIKDMFDAIKNKEFVKIDAVLIIKSGYLVFEAYFNGFKSDKRHDLRSATKSFTSSLVGMAIDKGFIASVDEPIHSHLDQYSPFDNWDDQKEEITVRHLLTMTPGWDCNDWVSQSRGNEEKMYRKKDWVRFIVDLPVVNTPGNNFGYCTGGVVVLGEVIKAATKLSVDEFSKEHLFTPLGITDYKWEFTPVGQVDTGGHLWLRPRDMAKFGQLFLQEGQWNGQRIISEEWIEESTAFHVIAGSDEFGFLWWRDTFTIEDKDISLYSASGNGGQRIDVIPSEEMVVVFTGSNYGSPLSWEQPDEILEKFVLKALK